jgi:hypothetical protein
MCSELVELAGESRLYLLQYLLKMATLEARQQASEERPRQRSPAPDMMMPLVPPAERPSVALSTEKVKRTPKTSEPFNGRP